MASPAGLIDDDSVRLLRARGDIVDLIHTYALFIRRGNGAGCAGLFTHDAVYEMLASGPDFSTTLRSRMKGREAIAAFLGSATKADLRVCPMIHNVLVTVTGDLAESTCVMTAVTIPGGDDLLGEYRDSFRNEGGRWRFSARTHTLLLHRPADHNRTSGE